MESPLSCQMLLDSCDLPSILQMKACHVAGRSAACRRVTTVAARAASFSGAEAEVYLRVHKEANAAFKMFLRYGSAHVNKHLLAIMSLLGPLRRCCSGGALRQRVCCLLGLLPRLSHHTFWMRVLLRYVAGSSWLPDHRQC